MSSDTKQSLFDFFCDITTCHGIADWYKATCRIRKTFWVCVFVAFFGLSTWQIIGIYKDYSNEMPYHSSVSIEPVQGVDFPNVTICNFNRALKSKMESINISVNATSYAFQLLPLQYDISVNYMGPDMVRQYASEWNAFLATNPKMNNISLLLETLGPDCNTTFLRCIWMGTTFDCCKNAKVDVNAYGKCFTFEPPTVEKKQTIPGVSQGLKFIMNPNLDEYDDNLIVNNYVESGFLISVSYQYEPNLPNPVAIGPGFHGWFSLVAKSETTRFPQIQMAPMPCETNPPSLSLLNVEYTKMNCIWNDFLQNMLKSCGCVYYYNYKETHPVCNWDSLQKCQQFFQKWKNASSTEFTRMKCLPPCDETLSVHATVSYTQFALGKRAVAISDFFSQVGFNYTPEQVDSTVHLDVYFPRLERIKVETSESVSIFTFISNLGGQLGLWLGVSACTVVQTGYYLLECILTTIHKGHRKKMNKIKNNLKLKIVQY